MNFAPVPLNETLQRRHMRLLIRAEKIARDIVPVSGARVAAILATGNNELSFGINLQKSHPFAAKYGKNANAIYLHAEASAIYNGIKAAGADTLRSMKTTLYVCRVRHLKPNDASFAWGMAEPCSGCLQAIDEFQIKRVVFTLDCGCDERNFEVWERR